MVAKTFGSREELIKLLHDHSWGYAVGQIRWIRIIWDDSFMDVKKEDIISTQSPSPKYVKVVYLKTALQAEIFLNRNLGPLKGVIDIHNQLGSYLGF